MLLYWERSLSRGLTTDQRPRKALGLADVVRAAQVPEEDVGLETHPTSCGSSALVITPSLPNLWQVNYRQPLLYSHT